MDGWTAEEVERLHRLMVLGRRGIVLRWAGHLLPKPETEELEHFEVAVRQVRYLLQREGRA